MNAIIKKMQYGNKESEIVAKGYVDGYPEVQYVVINCRGSHMCAYVTFPGIDKIAGDTDNVWVDADVHGGFTFFGRLTLVGDRKNYIGWDYAHLGDFCWDGLGFRNRDDEHKWTVEEVIEETEAVAIAIANGDYEIAPLEEEVDIFNEVLAIRRMVDNVVDDIRNDLRRLDEAALMLSDLEKHLEERSKTE